jgi:hypothetical protein
MCARVRGQSKAAGGEPERFAYEGPFDASDFLDESNQVREPKAVNARLSLKQYNVLRSAQEHRELLLLPTRGEGRGLGLVALRNNDRYPQFRDTLKNLLYLSTITQEQMCDRLLMLADLPTNRYALDVRELFGEDYDRITRLKSKLKKGGIQMRLNQISEKAKEFSDFVDDLVRAALTNIESAISRLEYQLVNAAIESRDKAQVKVDLYRKLVADKQKTIAHFDRALVTVLRRDFTDEELAPIARLFNFDLLSQPVGDDGIRIVRPGEFLQLLRLLGRRIQAEVYRDSNVEVPLPPSHDSLRRLRDVETVRDELVDEEGTLRRAEEILKTIIERDALTFELKSKRNDAEQLRVRILRWEQFQSEKADEPRHRVEKKKVEESLDAVAGQIAKLQKQAAEARDAAELARRSKVEAENRFNAIMGGFNVCVFPEFPGKAVAPAEITPDDFEGSIAVYLHVQTELSELDRKLVEQFRVIETALGSDYIGSDGPDTIRLLREELEALPEREDVLRRDWEHHLTHMRGVFDQVLKGMNDIRSAAERLNRALGAIQLSNLQSIKMEIIEGSLRKLANLEQPGLFDDSAGLEAALGAFRQKFEANPLLHYSDLFTLRFTVTGDDRKPHHCHDFRQVESHGTTITIKVLFNLLVLRSLLRENASKSLLCEVPFFLDEIHSLDPVNRHAILQTARKLGFIAITAAPSSISEVDALYFLQAREGRIVLRNRHRIGVKINRAIA